MLRLRRGEFLNFKEHCKWALIFLTFFFLRFSHFNFFLLLPKNAFQMWKISSLMNPARAASRDASIICAMWNGKTKKTFERHSFQFWFTRCLKVFGWDFGFCSVCVHGIFFCCEGETEATRKVSSRDACNFFRVAFEARTSYTFVFKFRDREHPSKPKNNIDFSFSRDAAISHQNQNKNFSSLFIQIFFWKSDSKRPKINAERRILNWAEVTHVKDI